MEEKLFSALAERLQIIESTTPSESRRLIHGRGHTYPGFENLNIDWFDPVVLVSLYAEVENFSLEAVLRRVYDKFQGRIETVLIQRRFLLGSPTEVFIGELKPPYYAYNNGLKYGLEFAQQQNIGFFLDMEPGRQWLANIARGKNVLNLFAYTCALSVVGLANGARSVVNVDMSSRALSRGRDNHRINNLAVERSIYLKENILKSWGRIKKKGPYDLIIIDPPSYQKGSFIATRDYVKVIKRIPELSSAQCQILACLNAPELDHQFIPNLFASHLPSCKLQSRLQPDSDFPEVDENRSLKLFDYLHHQS